MTLLPLLSACGLEPWPFDRAGYGPAHATGEPSACDAVEPYDPGALPMRRLTQPELKNTLRDLVGTDVEPSTWLTADEIVAGFPANTMNALSELDTEGTLALAEAVALSVDLLALSACVEGDTACQDAFLLALADRAWRRPLVADEQAKLLAVAAVGRSIGGTDEDGLDLTLQALLASPSFLYRPEISDAPGQDGLLVLSGHELASRLSYFVWRSMPDDELFRAAATGELLTAEGLATQVRRLLQDPRAQDAQVALVRDWLELHGIAELEKEVVLEVDNEALMASMDGEVDRWLRAWWIAGGSVQDLYEATTGYPDAHLAAVYGLEGTFDGAAVDLPQSERRGILTLPGFIAAHSQANAISPTRMGTFIRERLLCQALPLPPDDLVIELPEFDPSLTTRERYEQHATDPACAGCHQLMDPIGYGFGFYDPLGRFGTHWGGLEVDATGEVIAGEDASGTFDGAVELAELLGASQMTRTCAATQVYRSVVGRLEGDPDACALDAAVLACGERCQLGDVIEAIALFPAFRHRRPVED